MKIETLSICNGDLLTESFSKNAVTVNKYQLLFIKMIERYFHALYIMKLFYKIFEVSESNKTTSVYQPIGFFFSSVTVKNGGWR